MPERLGAGHVGDEPPLDLHDRQLGVGRDEADVGGERDLQAAAEGHAVDRGDHRHRHLGPDPGGALGEVGRAAAASRPAIRRGGAGVAAHRHEAAEVEPGAEGAALARQHDGARTRGRRRDSRPVVDQRLEHRRVEGVHLVGAVEADVGDAVGDFHADALAHAQRVTSGPAADSTAGQAVRSRRAFTNSNTIGRTEITMIATITSSKLFFTIAMLPEAVAGQRCRSAPTRSPPMTLNIAKRE